MAHYRAPAIPIRTNRSVKLRFESNKYNPTTLSVPSKSEKSQFVAGQNKGEELTLDKKLQAWYREKSFIVDTMNRYQNATYDTFVRIEGERKDLVRVPDMLIQEPEQAPGNGEGEMVSGNTGDVKAEGSIEGSPKGRSDQQKTTSKSKVVIDTISKEHEDEATVARAKLQDIKAHGNSKYPRAPNKGNVVTLPNIHGHKEIRPFTEGSRLRRPSNASDTAIALRRKTMAVTMQTSSAEEDLDATHAVAHPRPDSAHVLERLRKAKLTRLRRSRRSADDVASYKRDDSGKIIFSDIPYRRRKFPSPRGQDMDMFESRLQREKSAQNQNRERFLNLSRSITFLADSNKWSPLGIVRTTRVQDDKDAAVQKPKPTLGVLDYMVQVFSSRPQERLLEGLDPNSEEALRLCKYLRLKEQKEAELLGTQ